uniref:G-protein coupled receptors family 1 profile domain-containing protein n=1 Tax=Plectus sambesii TaxID=2011161 RepID=A0A914WX32_9BILA
MAVKMCLSEEQMRLGGTSFESWLYRYLFPPVFAVGLIGNIANLCVLLSPKMRNRANNLLSALAFVDMAFLLAMLPHSLANYTDLATNYYFRLAYLWSKLNVNWVANWLSAAAVWIVLAVCVDRNMGVKSPLYSRKDWASGRMVVLLVLICAFTGLLTSYNFFGYHCFRTYLCQNTQLYSVCYSIASESWRGNRTNPYSHGIREYVKVSIVANVLLVVAFPIFALIALNTALLRELRKQINHPLLQHKHSVSSRKRSSSTVSIDRSQELKVAITVCAIVGCFILTQGPSGVILVWHLASGSTPTTSPFFYNLRSAANFLVIFYYIHVLKYHGKDSVHG